MGRCTGVGVLLRRLARDQRGAKVDVRGGGRRLPLQLPLPRARLPTRALPHAIFVSLWSRRASPCEVKRGLDFAL